MSTQEVAELLSRVVDPELGIDIVALGLVYGIEVEGESVTVRMTTTTSACPMGEALREMATAVLLQEGLAGRARFELVYDPPWNVHMAEPDALRWLGLLPR